jgi:hypothetical protein
VATYLELKTLFASGKLPDRVIVAVVVKAHAIVQEPSPSDGRLAWAESTLASPKREADKLLLYVLAANKDATVEQINEATDAQVQTHVDAAIDKLHP